MNNLSRIYTQAIKNLVKQNVYSVDFAILKLEEMNRLNKINNVDFEELLIELSMKQVVEEEVVEEVVEETSEEGNYEEPGRED